MPKPELKTTLVEDFTALLQSLNPNYANLAASPVNRPRFDRLYRELSRADDNRSSGFDYVRRRR
jgi:hypothetical protein